MEVSGGSFVQENIDFWKTEAKFAALGRHHPVVEDRPEITDSEGSGDEHGEELSGMYAPGSESLEQVRMTEEQAERLRNQGRAGGQGTFSGGWAIGHASIVSNG
jgi:hypothetical protein